MHSAIGARTKNSTGITVHFDTSEVSRLRRYVLELCGNYVGKFQILTRKIHAKSTRNAHEQDRFYW